MLYLIFVASLYFDSTTNGGDLGALSQELSILLREKLQAQHVFTMSDMRRIHQTKLAQCGPGHVLGTGVTDNLLEKTVLTVGATKLTYMVSVFWYAAYMCVQKIFIATNQVFLRASFEKNATKKEILCHFSISQLIL